MSAASQPEFNRERVIDRDRSVQVIRDGRILTLPYRRAVGLISLGRATWYEKPKKAQEKPKKVSPSASEPSSGTSGGPKPSKAEKKPDVSTPAPSAEGDQTGYEPSLPDS